MSGVTRHGVGQQLGQVRRVSVSLVDPPRCRHDRPGGRLDLLGEVGVVEGAHVVEGASHELVADLAGPLDRLVRSLEGWHAGFGFPRLDGGQFLGSPFGLPGIAVPPGSHIPFAGPAVGAVAAGEPPGASGALGRPLGGQIVGLTVPARVFDIPGGLDGHGGHLPGHPGGGRYLVRGEIQVNGADSARWFWSTPDVPLCATCGRAAAVVLRRLPGRRTVRASIRTRLNEVAETGNADLHPLLEVRNQVWGSRHHTYSSS